jgi:hypothetical protein
MAPRVSQCMHVCMFTWMYGEQETRAYLRLDSLEEAAHGPQLKMEERSPPSIFCMRYIAVTAVRFQRCS